MAQNLRGILKNSGMKPVTKISANPPTRRQKVRIALSHRATQTPRGGLKKRSKTSGESVAHTEETKFGSPSKQKPSHQPELGTSNGISSGEKQHSLIPRATPSLRSSSSSPGRSPSSASGSRIPRPLEDPLFLRRRAQSSSPLRKPTRDKAERSKSLDCSQTQADIKKLGILGGSSKFEAGKDTLSGLREPPGVKKKPGVVSTVFKRNTGNNTVSPAKKAKTSALGKNPAKPSGTSPKPLSIPKKDFSCQPEVYIPPVYPAFPTRPKNSTPDRDLTLEDERLHEFSGSDDTLEPTEVTPDLSRVSLSSEVSGLSAKENVDRAVQEADRALQEMMASGLALTFPEPVHWYGSAPQRDEMEPVRVEFGDEDDIAVPLTDSAKQALKLTPGSPIHTWPPSSNHGGQRINITYADQEGEDEDAQSDDAFRTPPSSGVYFLQDDPSMSNQTIRRQMEVVEHNTTRTTQIIEPSSALFSDNESEEDAVESEEEQVDNMSWNSGVTEPEPDQDPIDTKEDSTQTLRHRRTQTPEQAFTQTPHQRKLPTIPSNLPRQVDDHQMVTRSGSQSSLVNDTNPSLMNKIMASGTGSLRSRHGDSPGRGSPCRGDSMELHATRDIPQQPTYLRDYQRYIESVDGSGSGPFVPGHFDSVDAQETHDSYPQLQHQPYTRSSQNLEEAVSMPSDTAPRYATTRLNLPASRDSRGEDAATNILRAHEHERPLSRADPLEDSQRDYHSRPGSGRQSRKDRYLTGANPVFSRDGPSDYSSYGRPYNEQEDRMSSTFPMARSSQGRSPAPHDWHPESGMYQRDTRDFTQQTLSHNSTQTPLRIRLNGSISSCPRGTISMGDSFVFDYRGDGASRDQSHGIQPWSLLSSGDYDVMSSRDFATQTFGQYYDDYHSHQFTQTGNGRPWSATRTHLDESTQTASDGHTQTTPIPELMLRSQEAPIPNHHAHFDSHPVEHGSPEYSRQAPPERSPQRDTSEPEVSPRSSRRSKGHKKRHSRERSHDRDTVDDAQSTTTFQSHMSRRDILKFMLDQVKDLKKKIDPDLVAQRELDKKKEKSRQKKTRERTPDKHRKAKDDDSAIESFAEDAEQDDKLYTKKRLELLYGAPREQMSRAATDNEARTYRRDRRHSVESLHSDQGDERDPSRDRAYDRLREKYLPSRRSESRKAPTRKAYTPSPERRHYSPPSYRDRHRRESRPRYRPSSPDRHHRYPRGRSPMRAMHPTTWRPPPQRPPVYNGYASHGHPYNPAVQSVNYGPPVGQTPQPMQATNVAQQNYTMQQPTQQYVPQVAAQAPLQQVPIGGGVFRPISAQPGPQVTPVQGTPLLILPPKAEPSPKPQYILVQSPAVRKTPVQSRATGKTRPSSAQAALGRNVETKSLFTYRLARK